MGQKVNPIGMRLGVNRTWESRWYAGKGEYAGLLHEDLKIRDTLMRDLRQAGVARDQVVDAVEDFVERRAEGDELENGES